MASYFSTLERAGHFELRQKQQKKAGGRAPGPALRARGAGVSGAAILTLLVAALSRILKSGRTKPVHKSSSAAQFKAASDQSLLVSFGHQITLENHERVVKLLRFLQSRLIDGIRNLHPAYCSVLIQFDALKLDHDELQSRLLPCLARLDEAPLPKPRQIEIPVCYGGNFGPDLKDVGALHGISPGHVIELHSSPLYIVYFLGFAPGFPYFGGLPEVLATPRLETPRAKVPAGSVGIGGNQTAVYPFATPGGWRLIGRTPLAMFHPDQARMNLLQIGDHVRFRPISKEEFAEFPDG
jgi:KipI family sensor histidine kinase inhibitor